MSKKTKNAKPLPPINVGDRVRHPNGTEGTVTATSGAKVTIAWPNDETTTWEASYLRIRGIKVIGDEAATPAPATTEQAPVEQVEPTPAEATPAELSPVEEPPVEQVATEQTPVEQTPPAEPIATEETPPIDQNPPVEPVAATAPKTKKVSAIDAAAQVLANAGQPMSCPDLITAMAAQGLWKSPGGQTPAATLYSAILREISTKGTASRFVKADRGKFAIKR